MGGAGHDAVNCEPKSGFEGPEKRLEVDFKKNICENNPLGLRIIPPTKWQEMLDLAKCTIISHSKNEFFDAFVLSESSLFVYPRKIMLKTCGTTTLLRIIPKLLEYASTLDLSVEFVMFSRKNFLFPCEQAFPHSHWNAEVDYLNQIFDGTAYVLGPLTQEHYHLYLADYSDAGRLSTSEKTLEIMMHNLDRNIMEQFYRKDGQSADQEKFPGIADLIPGSETDEFNFAPCGYSMNGLANEAYYTIHITPEPHCSYVSFETNLSLTSYRTLVCHVLDLFKPGTFTVALFYEKCTADDIPQPFDLNLPGYVLRHKTFSELEGECEIVLCNYESTQHSSMRANTKKTTRTIRYQPKIDLHSD